MLKDWEGAFYVSGQLTAVARGHPVRGSIEDEVVATGETTGRADCSGGKPHRTAATHIQRDVLARMFGHALANDYPNPEA
ncbi:hypothetical protein [Lysobacter sp. FW306-1B-D06B]|uniref:hypothetical protein n=1 Tax=Lysobacter sp. FW306-1B-D06B TaxID=3140250 RepID=UPI003140B778